MKRILTLCVAITMAAMNAHAQSVDQTQGVGGLVLDSLYSINKNGQRNTKYVFEYNEARLPQIRWEWIYLGEDGSHQDEPRLSGYAKYYYDDQNRQQKYETYTESNGSFYVNHIEEIAEYDEATCLPKVIYAYQGSVDDPEAEPELAQKAVVTKYHGNIGIEEMEVYVFVRGEWMLFGYSYNTYDDEGQLVQETIQVGSSSIITTYEYDEHGKVTLKVVQEILEYGGQLYGVSNIEMAFTNEYYDDGNLKTVAEYDDDTYIETTYYFWGDGVTTAIRQMQSVMSSVDRYYDMNGRPLNAKPTREGIYLHNGKKLIVK